MPDEDGFEIAAAWASVSPDTSDFQDRLDEELGGLVATIRVVPDLSDFAAAIDEDGTVVSVPVVADLSRFNSEVDDDTSGLSAVVSVSGDIAPLRSDVREVLSEIDSSSATVGLGLDASGARQQADALAEEFSGLSADLSVGAETGNASAGVEHLTQDLEQLSVAAGQATTALTGTNSVTASLEAAADHLGTSLAAVTGALGHLAPVSVVPELSGFDSMLSEGTGGSEAQVRIVPDASDFDQAVAEETAGTTVPAMLVPDTDGFQERVDEQLTGLTATVTLEADLGPAEASVRDFSGTSSEAFGEVEAAAESAGAAMDAALRPSGALSSLPAATQASIDAFNGVAAAADEARSLIEDDFASLEGQAAELSAAVSALDDDFLRMANAQLGAGMDAELADMTDRMQGLYGGLTSVLQGLSELRAEASAAGGDFGGLDSGLGALQGELNDLQGSLTATRTALEDTSGGWFTQEEAAQRFGVTIDELPAKLAAMDAQLAASDAARQSSLAALSDAGGNIAGIGAAADDAAGEVGGLGAVVGTLAERLGYMATDPFAWVMGLTAAPAIIDAVSTAVDHLGGSWAAVGDAIDQANNAKSWNISGYEQAAQEIGTQVQFMKELSKNAEQAGGDFSVQAGVDVLTQQQQQALDAANNLNSALSDLEDRYGLTAKQAEALAGAAGVSAQTIADGGDAADKAMAKIYSFADANVTAAGNVGELSGDMAEFGNDTLTATSRISALDDAYNLLVGNSVSAEQAQLTASQAMLTISSNASQAGASMTGVNEASVTLQQSFFSAIPAIQQAADAMVKQGDSAQQVNTYINDQVTKLSGLTGGSAEAQAAVQGLKTWEDNLAASTKATTAAQDKAASDMASQFTAQVAAAGAKSSSTKTLIDGLTTSIEKTGTTSQSTQTLRQQLINSLEQAGIKATTAKNDVDGFIKKITDIPKSTNWKLTESASGTWSMSQLLATGQANIQGLPGAKPDAASEAHVASLAGGGHVTGGSGKPGADDIHAMLSDNEFVMQADAVDKYGVGMMQDINAMRFASGGLASADGSYSGSASGLGSWTQDKYDSTVSALAQALVTDATGAASSARSSAYGGGSPTGSGAANAQLAKSLVPQWASGDAWAAWNSVAMAESGWRNDAMNPSSGAYGIGQALPYTKMPKAAWPASAGGSSDAGTQITWMRDYITSRYGSPQAAWQHEQCVPLSVEILTRRGWLNYSQLRDGDETIGYNFATHQSEWTPVRQVHVYDDAPLVRLTNKTWEAVCTPGHRWVSRRHVQTRVKNPGNGPKTTSQVVEGFVETGKITSRHGLMLAANASLGSGPAISEQEAELLGWVLGDGSVAWLKNKSERRPSIRLYQSKPEHVKTIDALVQGLLFTRMSREIPKPDGIMSRLPLITWEFTRSFSAELLKRSGYDHKEPLHFVLSLNQEQRAAFLRGVFGAEGSWCGNGEGFSARGYHGYPLTKSYAQSDGPQQDAIIAAIYLSGSRPAISPWSDTHQEATRRSLGCVTPKPGADIRETKPFLGGESVKRQDAGRGAVWCVTTDLGSWTMREGRMVSLTGNSMHWYANGGTLNAGQSAVVGEAGMPEIVTAGRTGATVTPLGKGGATVVQNFYGPQYPTPELRANMAMEAAVSLIGAP